MIDTPLNPPAPMLAVSPMRVPFHEWILLLLIAAGMCLATATQAWAIGWPETLGFVTGGFCVWLAVREHLWTWPIGLASNVAFFILFWQGRLFADAGLQIVYFILGIYGWWAWLRGGEAHTELKVTRAPLFELVSLAIALPIATLALHAILVAANGAAPFWDALTTILSLIAQILMCRKRLECWFIWMAVDIIYVPLYFSRSMPLTAVLYFIFLLMCIVGWLQWRAAVTTPLPTANKGAMP